MNKSVSHKDSVMISGVETLSQLPEILTYFHYSCPAPHIFCMLNLPDIH